MGTAKGLEPLEAAKLFIAKNFPCCQGALLAGSVVRGQETNTSDLDIVVFDQNIPFSYRESLIDFGWPIEIFVHNLTSYKHFFDLDSKHAKPSMPRMVREGIVLRDEGILEAIKKEAKMLLDKGPEAWTAELLATKRYFITDALDDFIGSSNRQEGIFIANTLAELLQEFILRTNNRWIGSSKWLIRALKEYDEEFAEKFVEAFDDYYRFGKKHKVIHLCEIVLEPYGGRLFAGFSLGKREDFKTDLR